MKSSHVPLKSLNQVHAIFMPDAAQAVSRYPPELILVSTTPPVLTSSLTFRHLIGSSLSLISLILTLPRSYAVTFLNAHHTSFWLMQLKVVWSLLLQAGSEGPSLISCAASNALFLTSFQHSFVAHEVEVINKVDAVWIPLSAYRTKRFEFSLFM